MFSFASGLSLVFSSLSLPSSLGESCAKDVESNTQSFENQRESEGVPPQEAGDVGIQDVGWPSEEETNILDGSNEDETAEDRALVTCQALSTSTESPVLSSSLLELDTDVLTVESASLTTLNSKSIRECTPEKTLTNVLSVERPLGEPLTC